MPESLGGENDLQVLLRSMTPTLHPETYVFCSLGNRDREALSPGEPLFSFRETEGTTWVLEEAEAQKRGLHGRYRCRRITLSVHSSLEAVGLLSAVTRALAERGISVNVASACFHDHLFVPADRAEEALAVLDEVASRSEETLAGWPLRLEGQRSRHQPPLVFFPGAGGRASFWAPVAARLANLRPAQIFAWPGFGELERDESVHSLSELVHWVARRCPTEPFTLIAQSMGGVIALRLALMFPERIDRLVLVATSGGVDVTGRGGKDWRPTVRQEHPEWPSWFLDDATDVTDQLPLIRCKTLLLWGDADPISPVAVGRYLEGTLPQARLVVVPGGTHALAEERADETAALIRSFVANGIGQ